MNSTTSCRTLSSCNRNDMFVVMGGLNAKVGNNNTNGERLCDFCSTNGFIITGTIFPHKDIHKLTWRSPDGRTVHQMDHVLVNGNMRTSISDTRVMRRADVPIPVTKKWAWKRLLPFWYPVFADASQMIGKIVRRGCFLSTKVQTGFFAVRRSFFHSVKASIKQKVRVF